MICIACEKENCRALEIENEKRRKKDLPPLDRSCAFCRETALKSDSEFQEQLKKRIGKGDIEAVLTMAIWCRDGLRGFQKDEAKGIELLKKATDMGSAKAMYHLGLAYFEGSYGILKDEGKGIGYFKDAVKLGDVSSRCILAFVCADEGNFQLASKHFRLAAGAGHTVAVEQVWKHFLDGTLSKAKLEETLRAHQSTCDDMDNENRQRSDAHDEAMSGNDDTLKCLYASYYSGQINAKQLEKVLKMHKNGHDVEVIRESILTCVSAK